MKILQKRIAACLLALCLAISLMACDLSSVTDTESSSSDGATPAYAYIAIDINPSVELVIADGKVETVRACNDDASVLLSGEDLTGLTAEEATEKIVALAEELGYLNEDNTDVKLTVTAEDDETTTDIEEKAKGGAKRGSSIAVINSSPRLGDEREVKELKEENPELYEGMNPAKLRLIKSIMEYDPEMTIEIGVEMEIKELIQLLESYAEEYKGIIGDELKGKFNERKQELRLEKQRQIAEIYGEEHLEAWNKLETLKDLYKEFEAKAENAELSEEDVAAILALIGEQNAEAIADENGVVTVESVEKYLDRAVSEGLDEIKDQIEAILDEYDEDDYELSEEELNRVKDALGNEETFQRLKDLEALIDAHDDELDDIKDEVELDDEQKEAIDDIKENFDGMKDQLKEEFKVEMDKAKEFFGQKKADRLQ